jgi:hypothetical protein
MTEELVSLIAALRREAGDAAITASQELARLLHDAADELERLTTRCPMRQLGAVQTYYRCELVAGHDGPHRWDWRNYTVSGLAGVYGAPVTAWEETRRHQ